jgi:hypothetical protein
MSDLLGDISFILPGHVSLVGTDSSITQELKTSAHTKNRVHFSAERLVLHLSKERDQRHVVYISASIRRKMLRLERIGALLKGFHQAHRDPVVAHVAPQEADETAREKHHRLRFDLVDTAACASVSDAVQVIQVPIAADRE